MRRESGAQRLNLRHQLEKVSQAIGREDSHAGTTPRLYLDKTRGRQGPQCLPHWRSRGTEPTRQVCLIDDNPGREQAGGDLVGQADPNRFRKCRGLC